MAVEMTSYELIDLGFGSRMHVLKLMHGLELDDIKTIRDNAIWFPLEQMLCLVSSYVGDCGKYICTVG